MDGDTLLGLATLIFSFTSGLITLLVRARLIEMGKDVSELKAQAQKRRD